MEGYDRLAGYDILFAYSVLEAKSKGRKKGENGQWTEASASEQFLFWALWFADPFFGALTLGIFYSALRIRFDTNL